MYTLTMVLCMLPNFIITLLGLICNLFGIEPRLARRLQAGKTLDYKGVNQLYWKHRAIQKQMNEKW